MTTTTPTPEFRQLGDHAALDLINTVEQSDDGPRDRLQSDDDVRAWLEALGFSPAQRKTPKGLLESARTLRETVRALVAQRKAGLPLKLSPLNRALAAGGSHLEVSVVAGAPSLARRYEAATPDQWLLPAAEAAADLLVHGDFELVRKCESPLCSLWFYDRTRSHRRRWCSMSLCGNRHKVAAFRQREAQDAAS
ncbi:CGNR zinc finger domain-containing protein [Achromobacter aegrifaciens]|uniref:CGNR zinc finger domain-containing protein n=1 Tax=Achromobacter aegrifaciens TaxID=1287736 RepID=A0ABU2D707_ACHAE|nr:ABATE domain-containing protein [Achromobacter aegrifaciens]MDR7943890.1 CGNR zinc finger domain-containing protein [Achromobacter aegrifaciens]